MGSRRLTPVIRWGAAVMFLEYFHKIRRIRITQERSNSWMEMSLSRRSSAARSMRASASSVEKVFPVCFFSRLLRYWGLK